MAILCCIDGNSLLHRSYHALAGSGLRSPDGTPSWALSGLWSSICAAVERTGADGVAVAFDSGPSQRAQQWPDYKAGRSEKHPDLVAQLDAAVDHLHAAGVTAVSVPGFEADDILAAAAAEWGAAGHHTVLVTGDRDAFSRIDATTTVLRVINGGPGAWPMLTPERLHTLTGVPPEGYLLYAALRGDPSDNLPGVRGVGPKTAARIVEALRASDTTWEQALADHDGGGTCLATAAGARIAGLLAAPDARAAVARNLQLMAPLPDAPAPDSASTLLPLDPGPLQHELHRWGMAATAARAAAVLGAPDAADAASPDDDSRHSSWPGSDDGWFARNPSPADTLAPQPGPSAGQAALFG